MKLKYLFLSMLALVSCTNDVEQDEQEYESGNLKSITVTAKDFVPGNDTRTDVDMTESGAKFTWSENDVIGIYPNVGRQLDFSMSKGAGTNTAMFDGGAWALRPSCTYAAYYPFIKDFDLDKTKIPISYENHQVQYGNASTSHLGKYDYMAAVAQTPENGNVRFDFEHLGCLVELDITLPKADTYYFVHLLSDEEIFVKSGTLDMSSVAPKIKPLTMTKSLGILLVNVSTTEDSKSIKVYLMTAPVNLSGMTLNVNVVGDMGQYLGTIKGIEMLAGKTYKLKVQDMELVNPTPVEWIDLGLPSGIKWANRNVGANVPEEYGDYFAWGDITPKSEYSEDTYLYCHKKENIGYEVSYVYDYLGDITGNAGYDAATANWGAPARMPTKAECKELENSCTWKWTTYYGVNGMLVTGSNGNSIFLPAAGSRFGTSLYDAGEGAYYWSSTPYEGIDNVAYGLHFLDIGMGWDDWYDRFNGHSVRPVSD